MGEREWRSLLQLHGFGKNAQPSLMMKFLQVTFILPSRTLLPCESEANDLLGGV
jgi:hypothetical protein